MLARKEGRPAPLGRPSSKDGANRIEESVIREACQRFDVEIVFKLTLCGKALPYMAGLEHCHNLVDLNLANNLLKRIEHLDNLKLLKRLNLASNQITRVENLWHLEHLEGLMLQDNQILSLEALSLPQLAALPLLRTLALQQLDRTGPNPLCGAAGYKAAVTAALPLLFNLDGERSPGSTSYAEVAAEMAHLMAFPPIPKPIEVPAVPGWLDGVSRDLGEAPARLGGGPNTAGVYEAKRAAATAALDSCTALHGVLVVDIAKAKELQEELPTPAA